MQVGAWLWGLLAPLRAVLQPRKYFGQLRVLLDRYGVYVSGAVFLGAWIASSMFAFVFILLLEAARSLLSGSVTGLLFSPARAAVYSLVFPVVPAVIDALLIMAVIAPFPRERPLLDVFPVRASSLLPYTLRVVVLEYEGHLSMATLLRATTSTTGLALLLVGAILTMIGLRRTMGASWTGAVLGGLAPLTYKLALGLA